MNVLLSIKPEYVNKILSGEKTYEFRKNGFKQEVEKVLIYSTSPEKRVIGFFNVKNILEATPDDVWSQTHTNAGIDKTFFDQYYSNKKKAYAIKIDNIMRFNRPLSLNEIGIGAPPQSFQYLDSDLMNWIIKKGTEEVS